MRVRNDLKLRKIGNKYMIVRDSETQKNLTDVYSLNETAACLWKSVGTKDFTAEDLVNTLCGLYDVSRKQAETDVDRLLKSWKEFGLLD